MITKAKALSTISDELQKKSPADNPFVVVDSATIERPFGWVFFYNSKKFVETGVNKYRLAGNGPVVVNKRSGKVEFFGSNRPVQQIIDEYDRKFTDGEW